MITVRPFAAEDLDELVSLWHETKRAAYPYLPAEQTRTIGEDREFFTTNILPRNAVWVAEESGQLLGYLAISCSYVDRLYVRVGRQRQGVGRALLDQARLLSPDLLELHTHQANTPARSFYEKHGFVAVELGISPPPECAPDVKYRWDSLPLGDGQ